MNHQIRSHFSRRCSAGEAKQLSTARSTPACARVTSARMSQSSVSGLVGVSAAAFPVGDAPTQRRFAAQNSMHPKTCQFTPKASWWANATVSLRVADLGARHISKMADMRSPWQSPLACAPSPPAAARSSSPWVGRAGIGVALFLAGKAPRCGSGVGLDEAAAQAALECSPNWLRGTAWRTARVSECKPVPSNAVMKRFLSLQACFTRPLH